MTDLPIDLDYLHQLSEGDAEFEQELLLMFIEDSQTHLKGAKAALTQPAFSELRQEAHYLKGSSGNVGAHTMHTLAAELEHKAAQQDPANLDTLMQNLETAYGAIATWVGERYPSA